MDVLETTRLFEFFSLHTTDDLNVVHEAISASVGGTAESKDANEFAAKLATFKSDDIAGSLRQMLDLDMLGLFVGAWKQLDDVRQAAIKSQKPPFEDKKVDLAKHKVEVKLHPRMIVSLKSVDLGDVEFDVCLAAEVVSAKLFITKGVLTALQPGPVTGSITLAIRGHELKKWSKEFKLLKRYEFKRLWQLHPTSETISSPPGTQV